MGARGSNTRVFLISQPPLPDGLAGSAPTTSLHRPRGQVAQRNRK